MSKQKTRTNIQIVNQVGMAGNAIPCLASYDPRIEETTRKIKTITSPEKKSLHHIQKTRRGLTNS